MIYAVDNPTSGTDQDVCSIALGVMEVSQSKQSPSRDSEKEAHYHHSMLCGVILLNFDCRPACQSGFGGVYSNTDNGSRTQRFLLVLW